MNGRLTPKWVQYYDPQCNRYNSLQSVETYKKHFLQNDAGEEEERLAKEHKNKMSQKKTLENEIKARFSPRTLPLVPPSTSSLVPECPVCLEGMPPPMNIFNCPNGHFVCGNCKTKVANCPKCFEPVMGRATGMEQMLRTLFETK